jgi:hypothetical protein
MHPQLNSWMATAALLSPVYMSVLLLRPKSLEFFQSLSTLIYIAARTPQIIQNYRAKSTGKSKHALPLSLIEVN